MQWTSWDNHNTTRVVVKLGQQRGTLQKKQNYILRPEILGGTCEAHFAAHVVTASEQSELQVSREANRLVAVVFITVSDSLDKCCSGCSGAPSLCGHWSLLLSDVTETRPLNFIPNLAIHPELWWTSAQLLRPIIAFKINLVFHWPLSKNFPTQMKSNRVNTLNLTHDLLLLPN